MKVLALFAAVWGCVFCLRILCRRLQRRIIPQQFYGNVRQFDAQAKHGFFALFPGLTASFARKFALWCFIIFSVALDLCYAGIFRYQLRKRFAFLFLAVLLGFDLTFLALSMVYALSFAVFFTVLSFLMSFLFFLCTKHEKSLRDSFLFFLSSYLFCFYGLRLDTLAAIFFTGIMLLFVFFLRTKKKPLYYGVLFLLIVYGQVVFSSVFSPARVAFGVLFSACVLFLFFCQIVRFSYLAKRGNGFTFWLLINFFLSVSLINISHGPQDREIKRILSQKNVKAVLLYPKGEKGFHGGIIRYVFDSCSGKALFLASQISWGHPGLMKVRISDLSVLDFFPQKGLGEMLEQDCKTAKVFLPSLQKVFVLSEKNLTKVLYTISPVKTQGIQYLKIDPDRNRAYLTAAGNPALFVVARLSDGRIIKTFHEAQGTSPELLSNGDLLLLGETCKPEAGYTRSPVSICRYSLRKGTFSWAGPGYPESFMEADPKTETAFVTEPLNGWVNFIDLKTRRKKHKVYLEPFVWHLVFNERKRILTVAGHFSGNLYQIHVDTGKVLTKLYIGRRAHWMSVSQNQKGVYVTTTQGVFFVEYPP